MPKETEAGQSLVLITLLIVLLLAFAGLAVDVGMLFARSSQFSAAVDAATLAGVVDLSGGLDAAEDRAAAFLEANRWPVDQATATQRDESTTPLGYPQFHYTVTYPVETYFLSLLGFESVSITHGAAAAIYSWADMPTATHAEQGILRTSGQYIFGSASCSAQGDPISAGWSNDGVPNPFRTESGGVYTYRIRVPADYNGDLEVQLFDPDSLNYRADNTDPAMVRSDGQPVGNPMPSCLASGYGIGDSCMIPTGEGATGNPVWLRRLDETWEEVPRDPDDPHQCPIRSSLAGGETFTRYALYYYNANGDRQEQAVYQSGGAIDEQTDMRWVTPGTAGIPAATGSFRVPDATLNNNILPDQDNFRNLYLDVWTVQGFSKNGWDLWAGSPTDISSAQDLANDISGDGIVDGNERNLYILENLNTFATDEIEIFAAGYLPTYTYYIGPPTLPVASVDQSLGGQFLSLTVFDFEASTPLTFLFSTMSRGDWQYPDTAEPPLNPTCSGSSDCNNKWFDPVITFQIPSRDDPVDPNAFYGGYLLAEYSMLGDEHVWYATLPLGRPFLTR